MDYNIKTGMLMHGFEFLSSNFVKEIDAVLHEAVYLKNGAKLLFIERSDTNKTFAIAFKTIPEDDTGVFHILEHSVLCGSDKYPVKEPFVELLKGSLKTFLNAFTFPDKTMYPVSSKNSKDFLNLVDVYMDAVLHPRALRMPEIFYQEGWHYELHSPEEEMTYKGVVFNEMKGAYSSVDEVMMEKMSALLYPDSCYGKDSGGAPVSIPDLTYEQFVDAHKRYYHPSNSRIILDGEVDLDKTLALLDSYLSEYEYLEIDSDIPFISHTGHSVAEVEYEISEGEEPEGKVRVCLGFATGSYRDNSLNDALGVLADAIAGSNASPFKKRILETGLCEDVNFIFYDGIQENSVLIEIKNVKREDVDAAKTLVLDTLRHLADDGIDKSLLEASVNILEFKLRENEVGSYPQGISYAIAVLDSWLYGGDIAESLAFEKRILFLREGIDSDYYEKIIRNIFLESPHSAELVMIPSADLGEKVLILEKKRLAEAKANMSEDELRQVIDRTLALEDWQRSEDSEQALSMLPSLTKDDLCEEPEDYPCEEYELLGNKAIYTPVSSNGITYTTLMFDATDLSEDEIFAASVLTDVLIHLSTEKSDAVALQTRIKSELGGFSTSLAPFTRDGKAYLYLQVRISSLDSRLDSASQIAEEILLHSLLDDKETVRKLVKQNKNGYYESIIASGHSVGMHRCTAYLTAEGAISEYSGGIECYLRYKRLDMEFDLVIDEFIAQMKRIAKKIFVKERLTVCHAGKRSDDAMRAFIEMLPSGERVCGESPVKPLGKRNEAIVIPAGIAYATRVAATEGEENRGYMAVVRSILSYQYLWNEIRVQGGAYGAGFVARKNGIHGFYTYRDPNPSRSLECFAACADFLRDVASSGEDITNFIIGAVGDTSPIITPRIMKSLALSSYFRGESYSDRLRYREELVNTDKDDIVAAAELIERLYPLSGSCVLLGKDKLSELNYTPDNIIEL